MDYLTTKEQAIIWQISKRRVEILCKEGRIPGAVFKGIWLIPPGTEKPIDPRRVHKEVEV